MDAGIAAAVTAVGGIVLSALGVGLKGITAARQDKREENKEDREARKDAGTDTAGVMNAQKVALDSAFDREKELRDRLDAQDERIAEQRAHYEEQIATLRREYEAEIADLHDQLDTERRERTEQRTYYENRVSDLGDQLADITKQFEELRQQLHTDLTFTGSEPEEGNPGIT